MSIRVAMRLFREVDTIISKRRAGDPNNRTNLTSAIIKCMGGINALPTLNNIENKELIDAWTKGIKQIYQLYLLKFTDKQVPRNECKELLDWINDNILTKVNSHSKIKENFLCHLLPSMLTLAKQFENENLDTSTQLYILVLLHDRELISNSFEKIASVIAFASDNKTRNDKIEIAKQICTNLQKQFNVSANLEENVMYNLIANILNAQQLQHICILKTDTIAQQHITRHDLITYFRLYAPEQLRFTTEQLHMVGAPSTTMPIQKRIRADEMDELTAGTSVDAQADKRQKEDESTVEESHSRPVASTAEPLPTTPQPATETSSTCTMLTSLYRPGANVHTTPKPPAPTESTMSTQQVEKTNTPPTSPNESIPTSQLAPNSTTAKPSRQRANPKPIAPPPMYAKSSAPNTKFRTARRVASDFFNTETSGTSSVRMQPTDQTRLPKQR
jgi:hypothetical protein